jgi:L-asparaginase/Glu-tRNA(Gln) amidotransferase subunit D
MTNNTEFTSNKRLSTHLTLLSKMKETKEEGIENYCIANNVSKNMKERILIKINKSKIK